jgi:hypothetical protein
VKGLTHIALDGHSLRGATGSTFTGGVRAVTAWATGHGLVLGREVAADHSNAIPPLPALLKASKWEGTPVTRGAAGCPAEVADAIRPGGGEGEPAGGAGGGGAGDPRANRRWQGGADDEFVRRESQAVGGDPGRGDPPPPGD